MTIDRILINDGQIDLRLGRWQDALGDVNACDSVICDPPYTSRVMIGYRSGSMVARGESVSKKGKPTITYDAVDAAMLDELAGFITRVAKQWAVCFNDHIGWRWLSDAFAPRGWYGFAPVIWVRPNGPARFQADGPTDSCEYVYVARPRRMPDDARSRPGHYLENISNHGFKSDAAPKKVVVGQKPIPLMRSLIRDYSRAGDLIVDPFGGGFTTAIACALEGRRCISCEMDPATFAKAVMRVRFELAGADLKQRQLSMLDRDVVRAEGLKQKRAKARDLFAPAVAK